jgi:EAL domain-containing protein (putative c-di-GMP-specific phosphodiesterase class I)
VHVAHQLRDRLRATDVLARLGGDEFAIVLPDTDRRAAVHLADELLGAVRAGISTAARGVAISTSIGIAPAPEGSPASAEDLLIDADLALAEAKAAGRDRVAVTGEGAQRASRHPKLTWSGIIRRALADDRFVVCRQPILHLASRRTTQHELLLRLLADDGQLILPGAFLYTAERFGLARAVDRWVIGQAVELLGSHAGTRLEINLSANSMTDPDLPAYIEQELARAAVDPAGLIFEVTETAAIANIDEARSFVLRIAELGCSFALDDFGAGFGSFYYLKHLPTAYLKIDGEFIRDLPRSAIDQHLVRSIVALARGLGRRTIAEHVGDEATLRLLAEYGVDYAQGYHIGTPILTSEAWPASTRPGVAARP